MTKELKQAVAPKTMPFGKEAFAPTDKTTLRWLGNSGLLINSRGTTILADPVLEGFDMPLLIDMPINASDIPRLDAVLITHEDNDHFSMDTLKKVDALKPEYHSPKHVADEFKKRLDIDANGHDIGDSFKVNDIEITLTPADHAWQNDTTKFNRVFQFEDCCGFWIETVDGTIWIVGDSRLLPEQLEMPQPDAILFDFSDNSWHIGLNNAIKLANTYPNADLILCHWGTVDAPTMDPFNADPKDLMDTVVNPERIHVLAAGEPVDLVRKNN